LMFKQVLKISCFEVTVVISVRTVNRI